MSTTFQCYGEVAMVECVSSLKEIPMNSIVLSYFLPTVGPSRPRDFPSFRWPRADSHSIPTGDGVKRLLESEKLCCFLDSYSGSRPVPRRPHSLMSDGSPNLHWMVIGLLPFPLKIHKNVHSQVSKTPLHLV